MIPRLGAAPDSPFPAAESALDEPDGLLAWGGGLEPQRLLTAYSKGIFPWYSSGQPLLWWSPSVRCVIFPAEVHVSRRLSRVLRQKRFELTADRAFDAVVEACATVRRGNDGTWITPEMAAAYGRLHRLGYAHSVETWRDGRLVGGIYGIALGRMFFGESMFSRAPDASKVALVSLCRWMQRHAFRLLDCQLCNPHLERMGAVALPRNAFLQLLASNRAKTDHLGNWEADFSLA